MGAPFFGLLVFLAVLAGYVALGHIIGARDPLQARLGEHEPVLSPLDVEAEPRLSWQRRIVRLVSRLVQRYNLGSRLMADITRANLPLTAGEFTTVILVAASLGLLLGTWQFGILVGLPLAAVLGYLPMLYVVSVGKRRQIAFTEQLPDVLTMIVSALRAGFGLSQAMQTLVEQLPEPASKEFGQVMRGVALGLPVTQALDELVVRMGTGETELMVTAINIQHELGGNLAQTLEIIGQTIHDRIRIQRELMTLTAQQRLTGIMLAVLPVGLGGVLFLINRQHVMRLFQPGLMRVILIYAVVAQVAGYLVMRKMTDLEV
ncbi:MAG: type II secretion system F family protein [Chloroflexota bacterium]